MDIVGAQVWGHADMRTWCESCVVFSYSVPRSCSGHVMPSALKQSRQTLPYVLLGHILSISDDFGSLPKGYIGEINAKAPLNKTKVVKPSTKLLILGFKVYVHPVLKSLP